MECTNDLPICLWPYRNTSGFLSSLFIFHSEHCSGPSLRRRCWPSAVLGAVSVRFCPRTHQGEQYKVKTPPSRLKNLKIALHNVLVLTNGTMMIPISFGRGHVASLVPATEHWHLKTEIINVR